MSEWRFRMLMLRAAWHGLFPPGYFWPPICVTERLHLTWKILKGAR